MNIVKASMYPLIFALALGLASGLPGRAQNHSPATTATGPAMTSTEQQAAEDLFQAANRDRFRHGLPSLQNDPQLTQAALDHARPMVQSGKLSHRLPGEPDLVVRVQKAGVRCSTVAENVAEAPSAQQINQEWMHSPLHRANLLDPRVNAVGIAVIKKNGELFAVQDFARTVTAWTPSQQERHVGSLLNSRGLQVEGSGALARGYCSGSPSRSRPLPRLVMRYSTADLSRLPQQVSQGIASGRYHRAIVGACPPASQNGFAAYQMVILLY